MASGVFMDIVILDMKWRFWWRNSSQKFGVYDFEIATRDIPQFGVCLEVLQIIIDQYLSRWARTMYM